MRRVSTHASGDAESRRRARVALERVARRGHGIMRRHGWVVDELTELPPSSPARRGARELWGDNLNRGQRIRLLLRARTGRRGTVRWMDEDRVFATFLHELAHMEIGPHDARFYALLETLKDEAELRVASDFIVCGRCVGGGAGASRASSPRNAAARAAARRRERRRAGRARARLRWDDVWAARRVEITIVRIRDARLRIARDAPPRDVPTTSATSSSSTDWISRRASPSFRAGFCNTERDDRCDETREASR